VQDGLLQVLAAVEAMALHHPVGLRPHRWRETMLDAEFRVEQIKLVLSGGSAFAQAEQAVGARG
jgi:hypothetical protein